MIKADIEFCGGGDEDRVQRLMDVYARIDKSIRPHIDRLEDHKGCLTAHVSLSSITVYQAISDAWRDEGECSMVIKRRGEVLCECA